MTVVLPSNMAPVNGATNRPYARLLDVEQPFQHAAGMPDWSLNIADNATADTMGKLANGNDAPNGADMYDATVTYEYVALDGVNAQNPSPAECRFVVRFKARAVDAEGNPIVNGPATGEQFIKTNGMNTFKFKIVTLGDVASSDSTQTAAKEEIVNTYDNIRAYVTSQITGYKFLEDRDITGNPYRVGNGYQIRYDGDVSDKRLDSRQSLLPVSGTVFDSSNTYPEAHQPIYSAFDGLSVWENGVLHARDYMFESSKVISDIQSKGLTYSYHCGRLCDGTCSAMFHKCSASCSNGGCSAACNASYSDTPKSYSASNPATGAVAGSLWFPSEPDWPYVSWDAWDQFYQTQCYGKPQNIPWGCPDGTHSDKETDSNGEYVPKRYEKVRYGSHGQYYRFDPVVSATASSSDIYIIDPSYHPYAHCANPCCTSDLHSNCRVRVKLETRGVLPADPIYAGTNLRDPYSLGDEGWPITRLGKESRPTNKLPGFSRRYTESEKGLGDILSASQSGVNLEDYSYRSAMALSGNSTRGLNGNHVAINTEGYLNRATGAQDKSPESGITAGLKLRRWKMPTLESSYAIEFQRNVSTNEEDQAKRATKGNKVMSSGVKTNEAEKDTWQYGDTLWYAATLENKPGDEWNDAAAINHAKLVFALELPQQVSFYGNQPLDQNNLKDLFEDDDCPFYVEWTHTNRHGAAGAENQHVMDTLYPGDLIRDGWTVDIYKQPNYGTNNYLSGGATVPVFAKPDADQVADGLVPSIATKTKRRDAEVVVFELAPPDDATDEEFQANASLLEAYWNGIRP